ncbi:protein kinase-like protein [Kribbella pratensis]|uniref:Protein kinase-like protein n=1 Tax=Kribbella pratensis TaxID=2512112 RepID=A0ABY2FJN2_9ACTN|nr:serine/threonine-protein kinase [Kribbella pratensis]TDW93334.1 protein kinase-like protein [Kribbella pratensis]
MLADIETDTEDGLPVWDWAERCELPGGTFAVERLGVGHRCETWLVWSVALWAPAVLKAARPHQIQHPRAVKSLRRETAALSGNIHPAVPRLLGDGTDAAIPYVLVEYVDGPTLGDELEENGVLSVEETALLGSQLLPALMALHRRGLAHLDVKPDNIVLRDGRPVLIDYGSARAIGSAQPAGHPVGTLGYASPAQEACEPVSAAMDLYSLGQTLAEACGELPDSLRFLLMPNPTVEQALTALAEAAGELRPWPAWLRA